MIIERVDVVMRSTLSLFLGQAILYYIIYLLLPISCNMVLCRDSLNLSDRYLLLCV